MTDLMLRGEVLDEGRLAELATILGQAHHRVIVHGREALDQAIVCGEAILEARTIVPRGEWVGWLQAHAAVSVSTAYAYEELAMHKAQLQELPSLSSIADALRLIKGRQTPRLHKGTYRLRVEITDQMVERGATWFQQRFPHTFAKLGPSKRHQLSQDLAGAFLTAVLKQED